MYICNDLSRITNVKKVSKREIIAYGNNTVLIYAFGDYKVNITLNSKPRKLKLRNIVYILGFHLNITSLDLLIEARVY